MAPLVPDISVSLKQDGTHRESCSRGGDIRGLRPWQYAQVRCPEGFQGFSAPVRARRSGRRSGRNIDAASRRGRGRRDTVGRRRQECGELVDPLVGDPVEHLVVGGAPATLAVAGRFLAAEACHALLVAVIDVPDPYDHGLLATDLRGRVALHTVLGRTITRDHSDTAGVGFRGEVLDELAKLPFRQAVDALESACA